MRSFLLSDLKTVVRLYLIRGSPRETKIEHIKSTRCFKILRKKRSFLNVQLFL